MANYDNQPQKFEAVGNGSFLYRFDIQEVQNPDTEEGKEPTTHFECEEVTVWAPVTANKITQAVVTSRCDADREQKLINEYNAAKLGLYGAQSSDEAKAKIAAYKTFLEERAALKAQVDADCAELGIV